MYALAIGISHVSTTLPLPIYALLSGLNASVVGVIAFAAVQLATKAITDPLSRLIVVFSACAGLCYNALWYFPILMIGGGTSTVVWDIWIKGFVERLKIRWRRQNRDEVENVELPNAPPPPGGRVGRSREDDELSRRSVILLTSNIRPGELPQNGRTAGADEDNATKEDASERSVPRPVNNVRRIIPAKVGLVVMALFLGTFCNSEYRSAIHHNYNTVIQHLSSPLWLQTLRSSIRPLSFGSSATCILQVRYLDVFYLF